MGGSGGSGGANNSSAVSSGSVQIGGPPCKPVYQKSLSARTDVETIFTLTKETIDHGILINRYGVFWGQSDEVRTVPLTGGTASTVVTGPYTLIGTIGSDLLMFNSDASSTVPAVYSRIAATSVNGTPTEVLTLSSNEALLTFDERFIYLYDSAATSIVRASLTDGTRTTVESPVKNQPDQSSVSGDYLYYEKDVYVARVPKTGGTSENFYYNFDLWTFDVVQDKLFVSTFSSINVAPLTEPNSMVHIADVPSGTMTSTIDWMTLSGGRVYYLDSNDGFGWVNLAGTQCEGLFAEDLFFGSIQIFDGYVYAQDDTTIRRMKLPK
jgi:hypothetical protein